MKAPSILLNLQRLASAAALWLAAVTTIPALAASLNVVLPDVEEATTEAGYCATCVDGKRVAKADQPRRIREVAEREAARTSEPTTNFDEKLGLKAWKEAIAGRPMARFRGGGWRSGNVSKSMCASVVKDVLKDMGVCTSRPGGDAYNLHGQSTLVANCPGVRKVNSMNPKTAPKNSIIIYSGYAGKRPHRYGHVEMKVVVTPALKKKIGGDRWVRHVPVGGYIYCSDYCRAKPTHHRTNPVAAIYEMI